MCYAQSSRFIGTSNYFDDIIVMLDALTLEVFEETRGDLSPSLRTHA
jgi:hypothetical protein